MAVKDYKIDTFYVKTSDGDMLKLDTNDGIKAIRHFKNGQIKGVELYAAVEIKRRQSVDTYINQFKRFLYANRLELAKGNDEIWYDITFENFDYAFKFIWSAFEENGVTYIRLL